MELHMVPEAKILAISGNMVIAQVERFAMLNSVAYCNRADGVGLLSEIIRIRGDEIDLQVFEETRGLKVGDSVTLTDELIQAVLGPGLLGGIYDGLQNPLPRLAEETGSHMEPGNYLPSLDEKRPWRFTPESEAGDIVTAGMSIGSVPEGIFRHEIMVPFSLKGEWTIERIVGTGEYTLSDEIALIRDQQRGRERTIKLYQKWPVKIPLNISEERLLPSDPLVTKIRIVDTMFPVMRGGTYCIPGPFGAGKTVLQHITSRHADIDVVVIAACGERAGEVVELIREFPKLVDPRTGRSLMERTIIICNTSSMPVAAREASVYTAATLAEYYRQMGLQVLLLADSTSRWAQAMRELSGRLEEIPGEEAFPAYLESRIANFYERAGCIRLKNGAIASVTIGGTVSPAGGSFEEPVTQGTLKVVGVFHGLSLARSDARRFPAIDPLESWSMYGGIIDRETVREALDLLRKGNEVRQMMAVVGEEGTGIENFTIMLKAEFIDAVYLQQNAYDEIDAATSAERQRFVFDKIMDFVRSDFEFEDKDTARKILFKATDLFRHWNYLEFNSAEFNETLEEIEAFIAAGGR